MKKLKWISQILMFYYLTVLWNILSFHFARHNILQTLNDCPVIIAVARYGGENCPCPVLLMEAPIPMLSLRP